MRLQKRRVLGSGVLGLGAALVLAGCGAGQITQTDTQAAAVNGANAMTGTVALRDASIVNRNGCQQAYTAGSNAPLKLIIANAGAAPDQLVSVTSTGAASATVAGQQTIFARSSLAVGPVDEAESSAGSSSPSPTPSPAAGGAATDRATVVLQGLKSTLWPGQLLPVTFVFRNAGPLTTELPIAAPTQVLNCASAVQPTP